MQLAVVFVPAALWWAGATRRDIRQLTAAFVGTALGLSTLGWVAAAATMASEWVLAVGAAIQTALVALAVALRVRARRKRRPEPRLQAD